MYFPVAFNKYYNKHVQAYSVIALTNSISYEEIPGHLI